MLASFMTVSVANASTRDVAVSFLCRLGLFSEFQTRRWRLMRLVTDVNDESGELR